MSHFCTACDAEPDLPHLWWECVCDCAHCTDKAVDSMVEHAEGSQRDRQVGL